MIVLASAAPPAPSAAPGDPSAAIAGVAGRAPSAKLSPAVLAAARWPSRWSARRPWRGRAARAPRGTPVDRCGAVGRRRDGGGRHRANRSTAGGAVVHRCGRHTPRSTGVLAVPNAPWPAACLLAASGGVRDLGAVAARGIGRTSVLTALAAITGTVAAACARRDHLTAPRGGRRRTGGAVAGALSLAPKLTVAAAGLGPRGLPRDRRAAAAHRTLTGLVAGWSSTAMLGVVVAARMRYRRPAAASPAVAAVFAADLGVLLLLRQRSHVDARRRIMLGGAGFSALLAACTVAVTAAPHTLWCWSSW